MGTHTNNKTTKTKLKQYKTTKNTKLEETHKTQQQKTKLTNHIKHKTSQKYKAQQPNY